MRAMTCYLGITTALCTLYTRQVMGEGFPGATVQDVPRPQLGTTHTVTITSTPPYYQPATLEVSTGDVVVWQNPQESDLHTVSAKDKSFCSPTITPGAQWQHQFNSPGQHEYFCRTHPWMRGSVLVRMAEIYVKPLRTPSDWNVRDYCIGPKGEVLALADVETRPSLNVQQPGQDTWQRLDLPSGARTVSAYSLRAGTAHIADDRGTLYCYRAVDDTWSTVAGAFDDGDLLCPVGTDGALWVIRRSRREIQFRTAALEPAHTYALPDELTNCTKAEACSTDLFILSSSNGGQIWRLTAMDGAWHMFKLLPGSSVAALAIADQTLWYVDAVRGMVGRIDNDWIFEAGVGASRGDLESMVADGERVWLLFDDGRVCRVENGRVAQFVVGGAVLPRQLRMGTDGSLWCCTQHNRGTLVSERTAAGQLMR